jgi:hypothetical protein
MMLTSGPIFVSFNVTMKQILFSVIMIMVGACLAAAQTADQPSTDGVAKVSDYRPMGETRIWKFTRGDTVIGQLNSQMMGSKDIEGREARIFKQYISMDVGRPGNRTMLESSGEHYVEPNGGYLGDQRDKTIGENQEQLNMYRRGDSLVGSVKRDENSESIRYYFDFADPTFSFDQLYLDEFEMFFAMHDFAVGDTIREDVFIPPVMMKGRFLAVVKEFRRAALPTGEVEDVFVIDVIQPRSLQVYFTPDKRLVQAVFRGQDLLAYQDVIQNRVATGSKQSEFSLGRLTTLIPAYLLYLVFGAIALVFFAAKNLRSSRTYAGIAAGALGFAIVPLVQTPIQMWLFEDLMLPRLASGGSPYFWSVFPALAAGIVQTALIVGLIAILIKALQPSRGQYLPLAAAVGVGLGIVEACHRAAHAGGDLFSRGLLESAFMILFHTVAGALVGWGLLKGWRHERWLMAALTVVVANTFLRYLPIFVQQKAIALDVMYMILPLVVIVLLFVVLLLIKRSSRA